MSPAVLSATTFWSFLYKSPREGPSWNPSLERRRAANPITGFFPWAQKNSEDVKTPLEPRIALLASVGNCCAVRSFWHVSSPPPINFVSISTQNRAAADDATLAFVRQSVRSIFFPHTVLQGTVRKSRELCGRKSGHTFG